MRNPFRFAIAARALRGERSDGSDVPMAARGHASSRLAFMALLAWSLIGVPLATADQPSEWSALEVAGERVEPGELRQQLTPLMSN